MTNNKQQTAVDYFDEELQEYVIAQDNVLRKLIIEISFEDYMNLKKQAKEMEKEQIIDAINEGFNEGILYCTGETGNYKSPEQYYNKTYLNK